ECPNTNVVDPVRRIWIFTTASLPWMTGTAVNPLLRAAFLTRGRASGLVTLAVPWLEAEDLKTLVGDGFKFDSPQHQEDFVRRWLIEDAGMEEEAGKMSIIFYPARYNIGLGSVFPTNDLTALVPQEDADVCVLEEPEHLNWYKADGPAWTDKFK
ncbi:unnamed protein product, partial [Choristocarpus tenellus]